MIGNYFVYILSNKPKGTLYIGVTNNLERRVLEHKLKVIPGFSQKYKTYRLVYFEQTPSIQTAISREKQLKHWKRDWKITFIERTNPSWNDLSVEGE